MQAKVLYTAEEFLALPSEDDRLLDLDDGEIVEMTKPGMPHGAITARLTFQLTLGLQPRKLGTVLSGDVALLLNEGTVRSADVAVVLGERGKVKPGPFVGAPDIVIEIVSPSEWASHINRKRKQYLDAGAKEVWIVEPEIHMIEVYYPDGTSRSFESPTLLTTPLIPNWQLNLAEIFD